MQCVDLGGRRIIKKNFFKQKTAYEISECLVGSEMCIRDRRIMPDYGAAIETADSFGALFYGMCDAASFPVVYLSLIHI